MKSKLRTTFACALAAGALISASAFAATASAATTMTMEATAYGPTAQDNYPYGATDYYGQPLTAGDIAVDPSVIPLGTCLYVTGYSSPYLPKGGFVGEADDTGGAIQGEHIDIFENIDNEADISNFGIQEVQVTVLGKSPDSPSQASGTAACSEYASSVGSGSQSGSNAGSGSGSQSGSSSGSGSQSGSSSGSSSSSSSGSSSAGSTSSNGGSSTRHRHHHRHGRFAAWRHRHHKAGGGSGTKG